MVLLISFSSCTEDETNGAPEIPPLSTMVADFTQFNDNAIDPDGRVTSKTNFAHAALNVGFWNLALVANLAIPVAAFKVAFTEDPVFDEANDQWVWSYDFDFDGDKITAKLTGKFVSEGVQWNMYITRESKFEDFLWYTGTSNLSVTEGTWDLNIYPQDPTPFLTIEWHRSNDSDIADIRYNYVVPQDANNGSYLEYGITDDANFDVFYNIYLKGEDKSVEIKLNRETKAGQVKNMDYFEDEDFHCWDENMEDIECN